MDSRFQVEILILKGLGNNLLADMSNIRIYVSFSIKIRNDILYVTGKDINPFNPQIPLSEQPIIRMSEKSNVPKFSENNPVIKKIENLTGPLNFEGIERNSDTSGVLPVMRSSGVRDPNIMLSCAVRDRILDAHSMA